MLLIKICGRKNTERRQQLKVGEGKQGKAGREKQDGKPYFSSERKNDDCWNRTHSTYYLCISKHVQIFRNIRVTLSLYCSPCISWLEFAFSFSSYVLFCFWYSVFLFVLFLTVIGLLSFIAFVYLSGLSLSYFFSFFPLVSLMLCSPFAGLWN